MTKMIVTFAALYTTIPAETFLKTQMDKESSNSHFLITQL